MQKNLKSFLLILSIWTTAGLLYSLQSYYYRTQIGQTVDWLNIIIIDTPYFLFWIFFTPLIIFISKRFPFTKQRWIHLTAVHFITALLVSFAHSFIYNSFRLAVVNPEFEISRAYLNAVANFDYSLLVYLVTLLLINIFNYYKHLQVERTQNTELNAALVQSQLSTLKMKLQPHFLFNTLNSIAVLIKENPDKASKTINHLSNLLRQLLKNSDEQFNDLEKEVEFIKEYLAIEKVRFGERLKIEIEVDSQLKKMPVPALLIQPLVENAVRHGIAKKRGEGMIKIQINKYKKYLNIEVYDNGKGYDLQNSQNQQGLGLKITKERLKSLYENNHIMKVDKAENGGTQAFIQIPLALEQDK